MKKGCKTEIVNWIESVADFKPFETAHILNYEVQSVRNKKNLNRFSLDDIVALTCAADMSIFIKSNDGEHELFIDPETFFEEDRYEQLTTYKEKRGKVMDEYIALKKRLEELEKEIKNGN